MSQVDFNFFKPTKEDINQAMEGQYVAFKHNEEYSFIVTEVKEDVDNDGSPRIILRTTVTSPSDVNGRSHPFFIRANVSGKKQWVALLSALFTEEQILAGLSPAALISKRFSSVAKITAKDDKEYSNFWTFKEISDVPAFEEGASSASALDGSDHPF